MTSEDAQHQLREIATALNAEELMGCSCCEGVGADPWCDERHEEAGTPPPAGWYCFPCEGTGEVRVVPRNLAPVDADAILQALGVSEPEPF